MVLDPGTFGVLPLDDDKTMALTRRVGLLAQFKW
jgi:hypothetical protein